MTYTEPYKLFAIAGKDSKSGDMIVKMVNAYSNEVPVNIDLQHTAPSLLKATLITLSAPSLTAENSFEHPKQYVPVWNALPVKGTHVSFTLEPYSINVLRVPAVKE